MLKHIVLVCEENITYILHIPYRTKCMSNKQNYPLQVLSSRANKNIFNVNIQINNSNKL